MPTQAFEIATYRFEPYPVKTVDGARRRDWRVYTLSGIGSWARMGTLHDLPLTTTRGEMLKMARTTGAMTRERNAACTR